MRRLGGAAGVYGFNVIEVYGRCKHVTQRLPVPERGLSLV